MAISITITQVKQNPIATGIPDDVLNGFIAVVDLANACFDSNNTPDDIQTALKLNGVWHMCELFVRGGVSSEKSPTGASRAYIEGQGFQSTQYGQVLQSMDRNNCIRNVIGAPGNSMFFGSVGKQNVSS